jgi:hypothetical protein
MTSVNRHTSVREDASKLRSFVEFTLQYLDEEERRAELTACIDRLEALATATGKRSGVGTFIHIVKDRLKTDTHCGRPIAHVAYTEAKAITDLTSSDLCKRCVQLYQNRLTKAEP